MPGFFSKLKGRDPPAKVKLKSPPIPSTEPSSQPNLEDAWARSWVEPEEVHELLHGCLLELKARGLDTPFLLLPFRPTSDSSAARTFIRNYFERKIRGHDLVQELRLTEPMALCSVMKWCWSRLAGGVVGWEAYDLFRIGEIDSNMARYSFATFIPLSVNSDARCKIIFDFFDLLSAIAAHSKDNGLGGRKLSRLAGWWAFEQSEDGNGFEGGYQKWITAADATSHLFFAYLRSLSPQLGKGLSGITRLPMSLQKLVQDMDYPPESLKKLQTTTPRILMIVDTVSPTPFSLLRRANHFQYRDEDKTLMEFSEYMDPVDALSDECCRVLNLISSANQSNHIISSQKTFGSADVSWSRFEDLGFSGTFDDDEKKEDLSNFVQQPLNHREKNNLFKYPMGRPTTPSWAEFLSSGFASELRSIPSPLSLPPDLSLPPIKSHIQSSQSYRKEVSESELEPGELASITKFYLDDAFWWVWISSLAREETPKRKAAFGRCTLIETVIPGGRWILIEEKIKGAVSAPEEGAYIAEKKRFWGRSRKNKDINRRKSVAKHAADSKSLLSPRVSNFSKNDLGSDQYNRIHNAATRLHEQQKLDRQESSPRSGRFEDTLSMSSVFTLQPMITSEASPGMVWARKYDKQINKEKYLANLNSDRGSPISSEGSSLSPDPLRSTRNKSQPVSPNAADSSQPSPNLHTSPLSEEFPTTPKFTKYQTKSIPKTSGGNEVQNPQNELRPSGSRTSEPRHSTDQGDPVRETTSIGKKSKKSGSGGGLKKLFSRNKGQGHKSGENFPPQANNGRDALERKMTGSSIVRSLSALRKKSLSKNTKGNEAPSPSPISPAFDHEKIDSSQVPERSGSFIDSTADNLSRVSTAEALEAQKAFSNFDQGPLEDNPVIIIDNEEHVIESNSSVVSRDSQQAGENNVEELSADRNNSSEILSNVESQEASVEETIEYRVARIKARVAQLTGTTDTTETITASDDTSPVMAHPVKS